MSVHLSHEVHALPRAVAEDVEIFAIGDIHGRSDLLAALLDEIRATPREAARRELIFLGDIIDRGPDNIGAIRLAINAANISGADFVTRLMGNHEAMMRLALDAQTAPEHARDALDLWSSNGGHRVIDELLETEWESVGPVELIIRLRAALPSDIAAWLGGLAPNARSGSLLFVHAGVNPAFPIEDFLATPWNLPLAELSGDGHWAWVRKPFLTHKPGPRGWNGHFVVHGHTPNDARLTTSHAQQVKRFRLNLDGGSAMTGVAKMAVLRGPLADVVTARAG